MIDRFNKIILAGLCLLSFSTFSQESTSFSMLEAEEFGVNNNDKMKNSLLDYEVARKKVWETTAIGLPQVSAEGNFQHMVHIPTSVVDAQLFNPFAPPGEVMAFQMGQKYTTSLTFNVSQLIFDGSYIVGLRFSKFFMEMRENGIDRTKFEIQAMVREAYYNVLVADKNVVLMDSILASTQKLQQETQILFENGFILKEEADQLMFALNKVSASKKNAERQAVVARNLLKLQMGYDFDKKIELTENLDDVLADIVANSPVNTDYSTGDNSTYQLLSEQRTLDGYALQNEKAKYLPSLGAFLTHSQNAYRDEFNFFNDGAWYPTTIWGIGLKIPITSSGQKIVKVQQAEIKIEQDDNNLHSMERTLEFQQLQLKASFQNAYENMLTEKENVELANFIYSQGLKKKVNGAISSLELTQLQNQLLQAEGAYIGSVMQLLGVKIELDKLFNK